MHRICFNCTFICVLIAFGIVFFNSASKAQETDLQSENRFNSKVCSPSISFCNRPGKSETDVKSTVLSGGTRVILQPEADAELIAITVCIRMEPDKTSSETAVSEITLRSLFGGSLNRSRAEILESLRRVGGSLETRKSQEMVSMTLLTLPEQIREAVNLVSESLKNAEFSQDTLDYALKSILETKFRNESNPFTNAFSRLKSSLQGGNSLDESELKRVKPSMAESYFREKYLPERTVIVVAGKFDAKSMLRLLDNSLTDYDRKSAKPMTTNSVFRGFAPLSLQSVRVAGDSAFVLLACAAPSVADPDYPAFLTLQSILGGGHASRLYRQIRELRGVGYGVGALYNAENSDPLTLYLQWDNRKDSLTSNTPITTETALQLLKSQLASIMDNPPTDAELNRAKSVAIGKDALQHERLKDRCFSFAFHEAMGLKDDFDSYLPDLIGKVELKDIKRIAERYFKTSTSITTSAK